MQEASGGLSDTMLVAAAGLADALESQQAAGLEALRQEIMAQQADFQVTRMPHAAPVHALCLFQR